MAAPRITDRCAIDGKFRPPEEHARLLVVGAGPAGARAAADAARAGWRVVLVDENPVPARLMGLDVPLFYGQRNTAAVQDSGRMIERLVASNPGIEAAFDAGVDVRLGVTAWGAFVNGPGLHALPGRVVGLADGERAWLCGFDALILATGARDLVLGFAGVDRPGVMGALALHALLRRYDAFGGRRIVILGSGDLAAETALLALERGLDVAALVEVLPEPQCTPALQQALQVHGVAILTGQVILGAEGGADGVTGAVLAPADGVGAATTLACDTICLAIGAVPVIELADVLGCALEADGARGGHVAAQDGNLQTSIPGVFMAGACTGLSGDAAAQGSAAAAAALAWLGGTLSPAALPAQTEADAFAYRMAWMRTLAGTGDAGAPVCLCEEVSRADLLGVQPPRYLGCRAPKMAARDAASLLRDGPFNPDQIKRLTRAGMGPCQGRRCREQIALLLALESGERPAAIPLARYRAPVRPLPLGVLAETDETGAMQEGWDVWFGIPSQWLPYAEIPDEGALP